MTAGTPSSALTLAASPLPSTRTAIFAATSLEVLAVQAAFPAGVMRYHQGRRAYVAASGDSEYWVIQTGIGHEKAGRAATWWLQQQPFHLVVSTGFACALVPASIGALLMGREVCFVRGSKSSSPILSSGDPQGAVWARLRSVVPAAQIGTFVSVDQIVAPADEKRRYACLTGAIGLDMESAALARASQQAHVPFVILRAVSDLLEEDLPLDFNLFLRPAGWPIAIGSMLMAPWSLWGMYRLYRQSRLAAVQLTQVFRAYAEAITSGMRQHTAEHA